MGQLDMHYTGHGFGANDAAEAEHGQEHDAKQYHQSYRLTQTRKRVTICEHCMWPAWNALHR